MGIRYVQPDFIVIRDQNRCIKCRACERQCSNEVHSYDAEDNIMQADESNCIDCQRCVSICPTHALSITENPNHLRHNANWSSQLIYELYRQAETGAVLLSAMGNPLPY